MYKFVTLAVLSAAIAFGGANDEKDIRSAARHAAYSTPVSQIFGVPNDDFTYRAIGEISATYRYTPPPVAVVQSVRHNGGDDEAMVAMQAKWPEAAARNGSGRIALEQIRIYRVVRRNGIWTSELVKVKNIIHTDHPFLSRS